MVDELKNKAYLHKIFKLSNRTVPYEQNVNAKETVSGIKFYPDQITSLVGTTIELKYRDHNQCQFTEFRNISSSNIHRPNDDTDYLTKNVGPEEYEYEAHDIYTKQFKVLRADAESPYRLIVVSLDYEIMLVSSTEKNSNNHYKFETDVCEYPIQESEFIGCNTINQFPYPGTINASSNTRRSSNFSRGLVLRVDSGEPCYSIMADEIENSNKARYLLGDEVWAWLNRYTEAVQIYDEDYNPEHNGADYSNAGDTNNYVKRYDSYFGQDIAQLRKNYISTHTSYVG